MKKIIMKKIKVLIVDDQDIIRDSLKLTLSREEDINVTGEAVNGFEAVSLIKKNYYDVVIMDINMPEMNGIESTKKIKSINSDIKILVNSMHVDPEKISKVLEAGASGFMDKGQPNEFIYAIRSVSNGAIFLSDDIEENTYDKVFGYLKNPLKPYVLAS